MSSKSSQAKGLAASLCGYEEGSRKFGEVGHQWGRTYWDTGSFLCPFAFQLLSVSMSPLLWPAQLHSIRPHDCDAIAPLSELTSLFCLVLEMES